MELSYQRLYAYARECSEVEVLHHNLFTLYTLYRHSGEMRHLLTHKVLTHEQKVSMVIGLDCFKSSKTFAELLLLILQTRSVKKLYKIHDAFSSYIEEHDHVLLVQMFTAVELSEAVFSKLGKQLETTLGKKILLKTFVDKELIAGSVIKLPGGKVYNFSLERAVSDFKYRLLEE